MITEVVRVPPPCFWLPEHELSAVLLDLLNAFREGIQVRFLGGGLLVAQAHPPDVFLSVET